MTDTHRWTPARKAQILADLQAGRISRVTLERLYGITGSELDHWAALQATWGRAALRSTRLVKLRRRERDAAAAAGAPALAFLTASREGAATTIVNDRPSPAPVIDAPQPAIDLAVVEVPLQRAVVIEAKTARAGAPRYRLDLYKVAVWAVGGITPWLILAVALASFVRHP
jgi:hypothetical protein